MKTILILVVAMALAGCGGTRVKDNDIHVKMILHGPGKVMLQISRHELVEVQAGEYPWRKKVTYWAALAGDGPTFVNPHFADNPEEYHCMGSVTLDKDHDMVRIDMRRIVSKPGEPEETQPHPANGMYHIEKIKKSGPADWWF